MAFDVTLEQASRLFPEYRFVERLAPSAQKAAFHVVDASERSLCLKVISPNQVCDRLGREIECLRRIDHPNVVRLIEYELSVGSKGARHFIVEEFIRGTDLTERLDGTQWGYWETRSFFTGVCQGLAELKKHQIVHRDLKPANIRVRDDGTAVLIDFGLARVLDMPDLTSTAAGAQIGTPKYFSPEQIHGSKREIDCRTDIFAVGLMMYEALTGAHPFYQPGDTFGEFAEAVCSLRIRNGQEKFESVPASWRKLVLRMLAPDRVRRPASPDVVLRVLEKVEVS